MARTSKTVNVSLPPQLFAFVEAEMDSGAYASVSAVLQDAVRALQREKEVHRAKLERLHGAIVEGMDDIKQGRTMSREQSDRNFAEFKERALAEYRGRRNGKKSKA